MPVLNALSTASSSSSFPASPAHRGVLADGARAEVFGLGMIPCMAFPICTTQFGSRALSASPGSPKGPWQEGSTDDGEVKRKGWNPREWGFPWAAGAAAQLEGTCFDPA